MSPAKTVKEPKATTGKEETGKAKATATAGKSKATSSAAASSAEPKPKKPRVDDSAEGEFDEETIVPAASVPPPMGKARSAQKPQLPVDLQVYGSARGVMKNLVPYVKVTLKEYLVKHGKIDKAVVLEDEAPLEIASAVGTGMSSYKEHWIPAHCLKSLQDSGIYEASGNILWVDPEVQGDSFSLPGEDPSWQWLGEYSDQGFRVFVPSGSTASTRKARIRFPIVLQTAHGANTGRASSVGVSVLKEDSYPKHLRPVGCHAHIWAWYVAVFQALEQDQLDRVVMLYECGLTVTIAMTVNRGESELALDSIRMSEQVRAETKILVDSFITFYHKVKLISSKFDLKKLVAHDVRFNGGVFNTNMQRTCTNLSSLLTVAICDRLGELDRRWGSDVLSAHYSKVRLLLNGVKSFGADEGASDRLMWCVEAMMMTLERGESKPSDFTLDTFNKSRDTASWVQVACAQQCIVQHVANIVKNTAAVDALLAERIQDQVIAKLSSPLLFNQVFPAAVKQEGEDEACGGAGVDDAETAGPGSKFLEELSQNLPKSGVLVAEVLQKVYDGSHDSVVHALALEKQPEEVLHALDEKGILGDLGKELRELVRALDTSEQVVSSTGKPGVPKQTLRELVRQSSNTDNAEEAAAERADVWKRSVAHRKKLVTLGLVKDAKKSASYSELFKKAGAVRNFRGVLNESHRIFVMSCDLLYQGGMEPWSVGHKPPQEVLSAALDFLSQQRDVADMILAFDGCMKACRSDIDEGLSALPSVGELFVVFDKAWNSWVHRKHFMGARNAEVCSVVFPTSRNRLSVKKRESKLQGGGEQSTYFSSYSNVALPPRTSLPRISEDDKKAIFQEATAALPTKWVSGCAGVPLFWGETKSSKFFVQVLSDTTAKAVVDVSPGSGALAQACMELGIPYFGMCANQQHLTWLTNVLDRAALRWICQTGTFLYQEDLATHIQELFADSLKANDEDVDDSAVQVTDDEEA